MAQEFRQTSLTLNKQLSKDERQAQGIFFTPNSARQILFDTLPAGFQPNSILEPSFGSGEFLLDCQARWPIATVAGVELNPTNFKSFQEAHVHTNSAITLFHSDFTTWQHPALFDFIVGNPPFFVTKRKLPEAMTGRPNIYVEFLYKCFTQHLAPNGILSFVLPTSFLNSSYYEPMRQKLVNESTILCVKEVDDAHFFDTSQPTFILTVQKTSTQQSNPSPFIFSINSHIYFSPHAHTLTQLCQSASTLEQLGFRVKTGDVVWNQVRYVEATDVQGDKKKSLVQEGKLTADPSAPSTVLYYSNNLNKGSFDMKPSKNPKKLQYVRDFVRPPLTGPAILVSRGYGNTYQFDYAVVPEGQEFYAENHVNVILPTKAAAKKTLARVVKSLTSKKTVEFIKLFVGNGGLSKTELEGVLPIF